MTPPCLEHFCWAPSLPSPSFLRWRPISRGARPRSRRSLTIRYLQFQARVCSASSSSTVRADPHRLTPTPHLPHHGNSDRGRRCAAGINDGPEKSLPRRRELCRNAGDHHGVSANASDVEPSKLLAVFVVDTARPGVDDAGPALTAAARENSAFQGGKDSRWSSTFAQPASFTRNGQCRSRNCHGDLRVLSRAAIAHRLPHARLAQRRRRMSCRMPGCAG